jgi:hypothetical protein
MEPSTIVLLVVSHVCKTWHLTQREEQRGNVFDSRVLMKVNEPYCRV